MLGKNNMKMTMTVTHVQIVDYNSKLWKKKLNNRFYREYKHDNDINNVWYRCYWGR